MFQYIRRGFPCGTNMNVVWGEDLTSNVPNLICEIDIDFLNFILFNALRAAKKYCDISHGVMNIVHKDGTLVISCLLPWAWGGNFSSFQKISSIICEVRQGGYKIFRATRLYLTHLIVALRPSLAGFR
jgi:hypothetical protein